MFRGQIDRFIFGKVLNTDRLSGRTLPKELQFIKGFTFRRRTYLLFSQRRLSSSSIPSSGDFIATLRFGFGLDLNWKDRWEIEYKPA
jgi:hypothetical protein